MKKEVQTTSEGNKKDLLLTRPTHLHSQVVDLRLCRIKIESRAICPAPVVVPHFSSSRREVAFIADRGAENGERIRVLSTARNSNSNCAVNQGEVEKALSRTLGGGRYHQVVRGELYVFDGEGRGISSSCRKEGEKRKDSEHNG